MSDGRTVTACEARGWRFDVEADPAVAATVRSILEALLRAEGEDDGAADATFALVREPGGSVRWNVLMDGELMMGCEQLSEALHALMVFVNQRVVASRDDLVCIHAAAVAVDDLGVLLPGSSGSGKTTLCARLIQRGAVYLTDDSIALAADGVLLAYPKPLGFKWGTWDRFTEVDLSDLQIDAGRQFVWQVPPARLGATTTASVAPSLVVAPRFVEDAAVQVERLPPHHAAERLFSQVQNLPAFGTLATLERLGALVAGCDCFAIDFGDAREAATAVIDLAGDAEPRQRASYEVVAAPSAPRRGGHPVAAEDADALCFDEGALLVRAASGATLTIDGIGSQIWPLLDGTRSVAAIADEAASVYGVPAEQAVADVNGWVDQLVEVGFVQRPEAG